MKRESDFDDDINDDHNYAYHMEMQRNAKKSITILFTMQELTFFGEYPKLSRTESFRFLQILKLRSTILYRYGLSMISLSLKNYNVEVLA